MWLLIVDGLLLIGLARLLAWMRKTNSLTAQRFSILIGAYWSYVTISFFLFYSSSDWKLLIIGFTLSFIQFVILYFVGLWIYSKWYDK